jgi:hypothetical protein
VIGFVGHDRQLLLKSGGSASLSLPPVPWEVMLPMIIDNGTQICDKVK